VTPCGLIPTGKGEPEIGIKAPVAASMVYPLTLLLK
jgi:hypothetical protein